MPNVPNDPRHQQPVAMPPSDSSSFPQPAPQHKRRTGHARLIISFLAGAATALAGVAVVRAVSGPDREAAFESLNQAVSTCDVGDYLHPGEMHASFRTFPDRMVTQQGNGLTYKDLQCVLNELEAPHRITSLIIHSKVIDGRMKESWDSYQVQWTRQEDGGLEGILSITE